MRLFRTASSLTRYHLGFASREHMHARLDDTRIWPQLYLVLSQAVAITPWPGARSFGGLRQASAPNFLRLAAMHLGSTNCLSGNKSSLKFPKHRLQILDAIGALSLHLGSQVSTARVVLASASSAFP